MKASQPAGNSTHIYLYIYIYNIDSIYLYIEYTYIEYTYIPHIAA